MDVLKKLKNYINKILPVEMEELVGAKFVKLFTDVNLEDDEVSIFVFDRSIEE